jgi:hypothetical protein
MNPFLALAIDASSLKKNIRHIHADQRRPRRLSSPLLG